MLKKISISPESSNYGDNDKNVAYLYRGYYVWQGEKSGLFDAWNFAPAVYHAPQADETFEPYWDDNGDTGSAPTRRYCLTVIDRLCEQGIAVINPGYDPDAEKNVTLTVSLNEARTILAALSRRHDELCLAVSTPGCDELLAEVKAAYQSVDQQTFHPANS
jgi:hypothetical protein